MTRARPGARTSVLSRLALAMAAASLVACGQKPTATGSASPAASDPALPASSGGPPVGARIPPVGADHMPVSFAPLARRADPAVVTVKARVERETAQGFVYDPGGLLLTNNHVIEEASDVEVSFPDGRELSAKIVGRDKHTDVAVLRIDGHGLASLPLGDSDAVEVGDWVVAIGNPFGLSHTVSAGILSARGRTREDVRGLDPSGYFNFLQTDASINPGNSGGPLLNLRGEVVGINSAVRANANGIGFAIPINMVKQLLPMLIAEGRVRRSAIGVTVDALSAVEAGRLKRPDRKGAWVKSVVSGGPAERAGISPDDVILAFEGTNVADPNELRWLASIAGVNKLATVKLARGDRVLEVKVKLGELPADPTESNDDH
jgi:serine protease Do